MMKASPRWPLKQTVGGQSLSSTGVFSQLFEKVPLRERAMSVLSAASTLVPFIQTSASRNLVEMRLMM